MHSYPPDNFANEFEKSMKHSFHVFDNALKTFERDAGATILLRAIFSCNFDSNDNTSSMFSALCHPKTAFLKATNDQSLPYALPLTYLYFVKARNLCTFCDL